MHCYKKKFPSFHEFGDDILWIVIAYLFIFFTEILSTLQAWIMDISCVFVVSKFGDVLLSKDYLFNGVLGKLAFDFRQRLLNELDSDCNDYDEDSDDDDDEDCRRLPDRQV